MTDRAFLDTNIPVYQFDGRDARRREYSSSLLARRDLIFCVSTQVLSELYVTLTRKIRVAPDAAAAAVQQYRRLEVVDVDADLVATAIDVSISHQISLWDAQIVCAAARAECRWLFTEVLQSGQHFGGVEVVNPFTDNPAGAPGPNR